MTSFLSLAKKPALVCLLLVLISCEGDKKKSNDFSKTYLVPKTQTFNGTTQENTVSVSATVINDLENYNAETGTYTFSSSADEVEDLKPGNVVLFETHSLRKIKSTKKEGGRIILETEFATLNEYFKDAHIAYSAPINWDEKGVAETKITFGKPIATLVAPLLGFSGTTVQSSLIEFKDKIADWDVEFNLDPMSGGKLKVELKAEKERLCSIVAEGTISSFVSEADIVIENGITQHFSYHNQNLEGELEIKFAASGLGTQVVILEIPAQIERTILVQGVIPVTLRLKANIKIYPEVAPGSTSQVSMKYKYNSRLGFQYEGTSLTSSGDIVEDVFEQTGDSNTATAGIAGMGVAVEFPRVEIGILGNIVVPYIVHNMHASSFLSTGLLDGNPCHRASCKFDVHAGVSMRFLGVGAINHDYKIGERMERWIVPGSHCGD
jgi:hypothetical protein